jgi:membrane protein implicated in regulation of membrane protease activity
MRLGNPLRDESAAFRLVLLTLVALGLIVVAARLSTWLGLTALLAELVVLAWLVRDAYRRHREREDGGAAQPGAPVTDTAALDASGDPRPPTA